MTAISRSLQGARVQVTGPDGRFRLLALPPGDYVVTAELDGFNPLEIEEVRVSLDGTVTLALELTTGFTERVTVSDRAPILDRANTTTGADYPEEVFAELPLTREYIGLAFLAPGVAQATQTGGQFGTVGSPEIRGASVAANRYIVDGLDVTNVGFGNLSSGLAFEFVQEVEVKTGAYQAEYGGALGGVVNVITKSGGNETRGDLFGYFRDDGLQASSPQTEEFGRFAGETEYDVGFDLGGKLIHDELWYFVALNATTLEERLVTRQEIPLDLESGSDQWAGKLSWQVDPGRHLVASLFGEEAERAPVRRLSSAGRVINRVEDSVHSLALTYSATLGSRSLLELHAGRYDEVYDFAAVQDIPLYEDLTGTGFWARQQNCGEPDLLDGSGIFFAVGCSGGFALGAYDGARDEVRGSWSRFAGAHELKTGINYRLLEFLERFRRPGPSAGPLVDANGVTVAADGVLGGNFRLSNGFYSLQVFSNDARGETDELSLFLQDKLQLSPRLTLNLGVRLDSFESTGEVKGRALEFELGDMIAPRLGFVWDATGNGRSKLYGHFGRFFEAVPLSMNTGNLGLFDFALYFFAYPENGSLPTYGNLGSFLGAFQTVFESDLDPGAQPMHTDEVVLGFEYEVRSDVAVGVAAVFRELLDVLEDIALDADLNLLLTNPGGTYTVNPATGEALPEPVVFPRATREYRALELTLNKRFANRWQLFASYVYSENEGNFGGLGNSPHFTTQFDVPASLEGAFGPLPNDRTHHFKIYGSYLWPFGLSTGFAAESASGTPINKLGFTEEGYDRFVTPRGSGGRKPDFRHLDVHLEYPFDLPRDLELRLIADVFNLTNEQAATRVDETWTFAVAPTGLNLGECGGAGTGPGTACPEGNPFWGSAVAFQQPRTVRLGLKLSW